MENSPTYEHRLRNALSAVGVILAVVAAILAYHAPLTAQAVPVVDADRLDKLERKIDTVAAGVDMLEAHIANLTRVVAEISTRPVGSLPVRYAKLFSISHEGDVYVLRDAMGRRILAAPRGLSQDPLAHYMAKYRPEVVVR